MKLITCGAEKAILFRNINHLNEVTLEKKEMNSKKMLSLDYQNATLASG